MAHARLGLKQQPECPECGHAYSTYLDSCWANDGSMKVRRYTCPERCGTYLTAEVPLPKGLTMASLDEGFRARRLRYNRRYQGYHGTPARGGTIIGADRLDIRVTVYPAERKGVA